MIFLLLYLWFNVLEAKAFQPSHEGCENVESQHYTSEAEGEDKTYALTADALANSKWFPENPFRTQSDFLDFWHPFPIPFVNAGLWTGG